MSFKDYFYNTFETSDHASDPELRTHYYHNDYSRVKAEILRYAGQDHYETVSVNDDVKEIYIRKEKQDLMLTLVAVTPYEIAVDIKSTTYHIIGLRRGLKAINEMYKQLDRGLNFKGTGLYK